MNYNFMQTSQRLTILIIFLTLAFTLKATYTLTDDDVEMDANGYIISCSYSFQDKDIVIPETLDGYMVKGIGDDYNNLFYDKDIVSIQFPSGIEYIGRYAFRSNKLTSKTISNGVIAIGDWAFYNNQLTSITIPNSVVYIGQHAFAGDLFTSFVLPEAQKEGYTFDNWNGSIPANTEVTDLSATYIAYFTLVTGIENVDGFNVMVYPNPTKGFVTIEADGIYSVEVMSLSGVLIQRLHVTGTYSTIDLSSLNRGILLT